MSDPAVYLSLSERVEHAIAALPTLSKEEIPLDDTCPICLQSFEAIHEGRAHEDGLAMTNALPNGADPEELRGVTKLSGCGHIFCRLDIIEWIRGWHGTCPTCRAQFANIRPVSYSEDGSSDGDYVPDDEDDDMDDEDDGFMDTDDGFIDFDLPSDDGGVDFADVLHESGLPDDLDIAADIDAFMQETAARLREREGRRRAPAATIVEEDADAYLGRRRPSADDPLPELPAGPGPAVHMGFLPAPASLVRQDSEMEVLRDLAGDAELEAGEWAAVEDAAMENWGLSHSDEEASESLSEGELLGSMEDISPQNDAVEVADPGSSSIEMPRTESK